MNPAEYRAKTGRDPNMAAKQKNMQQQIDRIWKALARLDEKAGMRKRPPNAR